MYLLLCMQSLMPPALKPSQKKQAGGYLSRYLHSDEHGGHPQTQSAPGLCVLAMMVISIMHSAINTD